MSPSIPALGRPRAVLAALALTSAAGPAAAQVLNDLLRGMVPNRAQVQQQMRRQQQDEAEAGCRAIVDWAGSVDLSAAGAGGSADPMGRLRARQPPSGTGSGAGAAIPPQMKLFADDHFKPVFGKAFDELTPSERVDIFRTRFQGCARSPQYGHAIQQLMPRVATPFNDMGYAGAGSMSAAAVTDAVRKMRNAGGGVEALLREVEALPAVAESWPAYESRRPALADAMRYLGDAERPAAQQRAAAVAARLATPALRQLRDQALAEATSFAQMPALLAASQRIQGFEGQAAAGDVAQARSALADRIERLASAELDADRARLDALPGGAGGLDANAAWYADFDRKYGEGVRGTVSHRALSQEFRRRRDAMLQAAAPALVSRVQAARNEQQVRDVLAQALAVRGDAEGAVGQQLQAAAQSRRDALEKARILGDQVAERPAAPAARGTSRAAEPAPAAESRDGVVVGNSTQREPTASEMYEIVKSQLDAQAAKIRSANEQCRSGAGRADPMSAMVCLSTAMAGGAGADEPLKITKFEKLGCDKASGKPGYVCDYIVATSGKVQASMGVMLGRMAAGDQAVTARFLKTRDGWMAYWGEK